VSAAAVEPIRAVRRLRRRDLPELLQQIHDPPRSLFLRGAPDPEILARPAVAIVGARACSPYGAQVARMLGRELAAAEREGDGLERRHHLALRDPAEIAALGLAARIL